MIDGNRIRLFAARMAGGYIRAAKSAGAFLLILLAVAGISAAIVTPLWFLATRYTALYTVVSVCALTAALLTSFAIRLAKDQAGRKLFFRRCLRFLIFLMLAVFLYFVVLLYVRGSFLVAAPLTILYIAVTGRILYGKRTA